MVAFVEIGVGCDLLVQQAGRMGNTGNQRGVRASPFNSINKMPEDILLEEVTDELDSIEFLLDSEVALRKPADSGAKCKPNSLKFTLFTEFVECLENVRCDLVNVGVMELGDIDVVGSQSFQAPIDSIADVIRLNFSWEFPVASLGVGVEIVTDLRP